MAEDEPIYANPDNLDRLYDNIKRREVQTFDTVAAMQAATYLETGMTCHTNGYTTSGDGGAAYYTVGTSGDIALQGGLYASVIVDKVDALSMALDMSYRRVAYTNAVGTVDVYYAVIPASHAPSLVLANGSIDSVEHEVDAAFRTKSDVLINAGVFNISDGTTVGPVIVDGQAVNDEADSSSSASEHSIIYMTTDGTLNSTVDSSVTASALLAQYPNIVWAVTGFKAIVRNGSPVVSQSTTYQPRSVIAQDSDGNYLVMSCAGRMYEQVGLTVYDCYEFMLSVGFTPYFAFNLDGGASVGLTAMGIRNVPLVNNTHRRQANFIAFSLGETNEREFDFNRPAALAVVDEMYPEQYFPVPWVNITGSADTRHFGFRYPVSSSEYKLECVMQYNHSTRTFTIRTLNDSNTLTDVMQLSTDAHTIGGSKIYTEADYNVLLGWEYRNKDTEYSVDSFAGDCRIVTSYYLDSLFYEVTYYTRDLRGLTMPTSGASVVFQGALIKSDGTVIPIPLTLKNTDGSYSLSYTHTYTSSIRLMRVVSTDVL